MPERTKGQRVVLAAGALVIGGAFVWLAAATVLAVGIGQMLNTADRLESERRPAPEPVPLLGVVPPPREPDPDPPAA